MRPRNFRLDSLVSVSLLLAINLCVTASSDDDGWERYKLRYGKQFKDKATERTRRTNRQRKIALIETHNRAAFGNGTKATYFLRENILTDLTDEDYAKMLGFRSEKFNTSPFNQTARSARRRRQSWQIYYNTVDVNTLPLCVNWAEKGWVGPVLYQGNCGSCWSYTTVGSLQAQYYNVSGQFVQLSTQNLIDCSYRQGNMGCHGGNMQNAYRYIASNGIESSGDYPDTSKATGTNGTCRYNPSLSVTSLDSYRDIDFGNERALQQAVALIGPVAAGIAASSLTFQNYGGGVYNDPACGSYFDLNHAVLVIGYGIYNQQPYWLIQNSWGTSWGIGGYMMLARNASNRCGIAFDASFPIINRKSDDSRAPVSGSANCSDLWLPPSSAAAFRLTALFAPVISLILATAVS